MSTEEENNKTADPTLAIYGAIQFAYSYFNKALFDNALPKGIVTFHRQRKVMGYASFQRWKGPDGNRVDEIAINPEYFEDYPLIEIFQTLCHEMTHLWQSHFGCPSRRGYHNKEWARKMKEIGLMPSSTGLPGGDQTGEHMLDYVILDGPFIKVSQDLIKKGYDFPWVDCFPVVRLKTPVVAYRLDNVPVELDKALKPKQKQTHKQDSFVLTDNIHTIDDYSSFSDWDTDTPQSVSEFHTTLPKDRSGRVKYSCPACGCNVWGKPSLNISCDDCNQQLRIVT
jgi:hypothetical protein